MPAHLDYYTACIGHWSAPFAMRITDVAALRRSGPGLLDRIGLRLLGAWPAWLGTLRMVTSVAVHPSGQEVRHTTAVHWGPLVLFSSVETIHLQPDGHSFTLEGRQGPGPLGWPSVRIHGDGEVEADAAHARYRLAWMGTTLVQTTTMRPGEVDLTQTSPWSYGEVALRRRA